MGFVSSTHAVAALVRRSKLAWVTGALVASACGSGGPRLELFYTDDVVGAPTRNVSITAVTGATCEQVLSVQHTEISSVGTVVGQRMASFPIDPSAGILSDFPDDLEIALDITALSRSGLRVARTCREVRLDSQDNLQIELVTLPPCKSPRSELDVMIVLDTSGTVAIVDPMQIRGPAIVAEIIDKMDVPSWGLVTYGHEDLAVERVSATADPATMRSGVLAAGSLSTGATRLFAGMAKGAELLRARSVCGRRPVLLMVSGQRDEGPVESFQEASTGVYSVPSYREDDIFVFAIAMSEVGVADLTAVIQGGDGVVTMATTDLELRAALGRARSTFVAITTR